METIMDILNSLHPEYDFSESSNFIEDGYLDSFDVVTIVSLIEEKFDILVDGLDIVPENFYSLGAIASMINKNGGKCDLTI